MRTGGAARAELALCLWQVSSTTWGPTMTQGGIFDTDATLNPFASASKVYLAYCSSDGWVGDSPAAATQASFGFNFGFHGRRILRATLQALQARPRPRATAWLVARNPVAASPAARQSAKVSTSSSLFRRATALLRRAASCETPQPSQASAQPGSAQPGSTQPGSIQLPRCARCSIRQLSAHHRCTAACHSRMPTAVRLQDDFGLGGTPGTRILLSGCSAGAHPFLPISQAVPGTGRAAGVCGTRAAHPAAICNAATVDARIFWCAVHASGARGAMYNVDAVAAAVPSSIRVQVRRPHAPAWHTELVAETRALYTGPAGPA